MAIDLLIINARGLPMTSPGARCSTVAVERGRIVFVGDRAPTELTQQARQVIDLEGSRSLVPGFVDAHQNFGALAAVQGDIDASFACNYREIAESWATFGRKGRTERRPIIISGICPERLEEGRLPDRHWLDTTTAGAPVLLLAVDGQVALASSALSATIKSSRGAMAPFETGGEAVQGANAEALLAWVRRRRGRARHVSSLFSAAHACVGIGITTALSAETGSAAQGPLEQRAAHLRPALPLRVVPFDSCLQLPRPGRSQAKRLGGCTAWVHTPSPGDPLASALLHLKEMMGLCSERSNGGVTALNSLDDATRWVWAALRAGLQPALMALDSGSVHTAALALQTAVGRAQLVDVRPRLIGCLDPHPDDLARLADVGAAVTTPAAWMADQHPVALWLRRRLGAVAAANLLPHRQILGAGLHWSIGSFAPGPELSMLRGIAGAVKHPNVASRVEPEQALTAATVEAARAGFQESDRGTLALGKVADFVILRGDPLADAGGLQVETTFVRGRPIQPRQVALPRAYLGALAGRLRETLGG